MIVDTGSLYKSISSFSDDEIKQHIRSIRNLRRQFLDVKVKAPKASKGKKKATVVPDIDKLSPDEKQVLLQKFLKIKEKRDGKTCN